LTRRRRDVDRVAPANAPPRCEGALDAVIFGRRLADALRPFAPDFDERRIVLHQVGAAARGVVTNVI
jgi:hypothetical protein